ncbi:YbfB/YjiJ family MFS transporter [Agrobacterium vitis]|uniref:YbfB/YjiJ family MFS transporter n=1 Tax=Agrobacterium vitis TaxID=373 RepID=UPI003D2C6B39
MTDRVLTPLGVAGFSATLIGNGIGRFAYIALMPALITAGWFTVDQASLLGAATLFGYLFGVPLTELAVRRMAAGQVLRLAAIVCALSYFACAFSGASFIWYLVWRCITGITGAMLMVLAAPLVVPRHIPAVRNVVSGLVFSGVGVGAIISGTLIPILLIGGLQAAWVGIGMISLALALYCWRVIDDGPETAPPQKLPASHSVNGVNPTAEWLLLIAYTLNAVGYLPHTLFWVDYIVRELDMSMMTGGLLWATFGLGAAVGPMLTGQMAARIGTSAGLFVGLVSKAIAVALPLMSSSVPTLATSAFFVGVTTPGVASLVSSCTLEFVGTARFRPAWGRMTFGFAAAQAICGYMMVEIVSHTTSYRPLFLISAIALLGAVLATAIILALRPSNAAN